MNLNIINPRFLAPALLLLAAALGTTGCSQSDDAPMAATTQPLNITVAPRPAFAPAGEGADTRSPVGDNGKFTWDNGDVIYLLIKFNDAPTNTIKRPLMIFSNNSWNLCKDWENPDPINNIEWPLGADKAEVRAMYTNSTVKIGESSMTFPDPQEPGKGAHMDFSATITPGQSVTIDLKHVTTLFRFSGLPANTKYVVVNTSYYKLWNSGGFNSDIQNCPFTTDDSGNGILYGTPYNHNSAAPTYTVSLGTPAAPYTPIYTATLQAQGTAGAYTMDGYYYNVSVAGSGDVTPDKYPDLLPPRYNGQEPLLLAIPGQTAYWVAPVNVGTYNWTGVNSTAKCPDGWHIPTKDDFVAMTGITTNKEDSTNYAAISAVFPGDVNYWSATAGDSSAYGWYLSVASSDYSYSYFGHYLRRFCFF